MTDGPRIRIVQLPEGTYGMILDRMPTLEPDVERILDYCRGRELVLSDGRCMWVLRFDHEVEIDG